MSRYFRFFTVFLFLRILSAGLLAEPVLEQLRKAQGSLEVAEYYYQQLSPGYQSSLVDHSALANQYLAALYAAKRLTLTASLNDRVYFSLLDQQEGDLARNILETPKQADAELAPIYPDKDVPEGVVYGEAPLITVDPASWAAPGYWGKGLDQAVMAGWTLKPGRLEFQSSAMAIVRNDLTLDAAEVSGEFKINDGSGIYVVLRSDVIVKFFAGKNVGNGNVQVKYGYNNLNVSNDFGEAPVFERRNWYAFSIRLEGERVVVSIDGEEVLDSRVSNHPSLSGAVFARSGYFGFGTFKASGAFKRVQVKGLTPAAQENLPRLQAPRTYSGKGPVVDVLAGKPESFVGLVHHKVDAYSAKLQQVEDGVLKIRGAPYVQFSCKGIEGEHWIAKGKVRLLEKGSVWFRANNKLLFGLKDKGSAKGGVVKFSTGNFNYADEASEMPGLELDRWYSWELEYHYPTAAFRLNGERVMAAVTPEAKKLLHHFGVSTYNTKADVKALSVELLQAGAPPGRLSKAEIAGLYAKGLKAIEQVATTADPMVAATLKGERSPLLATSEDFVTLADNFKKQKDWTTALSLLVANYSRFEGDERETEKERWSTFREAFDQVLKNVARGDIGLDHVLQVGEEDAQLLGSPDGRRFAILLKDPVEVVLYDPWTGKTSERVKIEERVDHAVVRYGHLVYTVRGKSSELRSLNLATGKPGFSANFEGDITDFQPHPQRHEWLVCVNQNEGDAQYRFTHAVVFRVVPEGDAVVEPVPTGAIGQFLRPGPWGVLYTGFHASPQEHPNMDPGPLQVEPAGGGLDHLLAYSMAGEVFELLAERPAPGMEGHSIALSPDGREVCYLGKFSRGHQDGRQLRQGLLGLAAHDLQEVRGVYEAGHDVRLIAWHPRDAEAYVYNGRELYRFNTEDYSVLSKIPLPEMIEQEGIREMTITPDGKHLLLNFSGARKGVYVQSLNGEVLPVPSKLVQSMLENPSQDLASLNVDPEDWKTLAETFAFSAAGELAAKKAMPKRVTDLMAKAEPIALEATGLTKVDGDGPLISLKAAVSAKKKTEEDPADLVAWLAELNSLKSMGDHWPDAWFARWGAALEAFPADERLLLMGGRRMLRLDEPDGALNVARRLIATPENSAANASGYALLADLNQEKEDYPQAVAAWDKALAINPMNFIWRKRLGDLYSKAGYPGQARLQWRTAHHLFPNNPELAKALSKGTEGLEPMSTAKIFAETSPSIAVIRQKNGTGSGFVIGRNGYLLTNQHVVQSEKKVEVTFTDAEGEEKTFPAQVLKTDAMKDIALLVIDPEGLELNPLSLALTRKVMTGDEVVAIGNPGLGANVLTLTATEGIVSSAIRKLGSNRYIQTSAAVNQGNSGGPLLDRQGQVIGMITLKAQLENVGFAVPARELLKFVEDYVE